MMRYQRHKRLHGRKSSIAQSARRAVNLAQRWGDFLQQKDCAIGSSGRIMARQGFDFRQGSIDPPNRQARAVPAKSTSAETATESPGDGRWLGRDLHDWECYPCSSELH